LLIYERFIKEYGERKWALIFTFLKFLRNLKEKWQ
jgi:hypothetical protein